METYAQLGLQLPQPPLTVRLFEIDNQGFSFFADDSLLFRLTPIKFKRTVILDSTNQFINISEYMDKLRGDKKSSICDCITKNTGKWD